MPHPRRTLTWPAVVVLVALATMAAACGSTPAEDAGEATEPTAAAAPSATAGTGAPATQSDEPTAAPTDVASLAQEASPERAELLAEMAADGPPLSLYTTLSVEDVDPVVAAFREQYGLEVEVYRALAPDVTARAANEILAGRPGFDVVWANGQAMTNLEQEEAFTSFVSASADGIPEELISSEVWMPTDVNYWSWAFNPDLITQEQAPSTYQDLTAPEWSGQISLARYVDWFATVWGSMGEEAAQEFFTALAANDPFITRPSFTLAQQFVSTGEMPLTISTTSSLAHRENTAGAPIQGYFPEGPTVARPNGAGWNSEGPSPSAGLLFSEFLLDSEGGQSVLSDIGRIPVHTAVEVDPPTLRAEDFVTVDFEAFVTEQAMWDERWEQIFGAEVFEG